MSSKGNILIVDDEQSLRLVLDTVLRKDGYEVDTAENGIQAIEMLKTREYETVILDIRMTQIDGLQTFSEIHKMKPNLPIVLTTAYGSGQDAVEAMKRGAFDYLTKPFNVEQVKFHVARAIRMRRLTCEVEQLCQEVEILSQNKKES